MRLLVITDSVPPSNAGDALLPTLTDLLGRGHQISVLAKRAPAATPAGNIDPRICVRRILSSNGWSNYWTTRRVLSVALPDLVLVWRATTVGSCPIHAVLHASEATVAYAIDDAKFAQWAPRRGRLGGPQVTSGNAFALSAAARDEVVRAGRDVASAPVIELGNPARREAAIEDLHRLLVKLYTANRFDRYKAISAYKRHPRPFLQA